MLWIHPVPINYNLEISLIDKNEIPLSVFLGELFLPRRVSIMTKYIRYTHLYYDSCQQTESSWNIGNVKEVNKSVLKLQHIIKLEHFNFCLCMKFNSFVKDLVRIRKNYQRGHELCKIEIGTKKQFEVLVKRIQKLTFFIKARVEISTSLK